MLYLMGIDHKKLTFKFQGRDFRLDGRTRERRAENPGIDLSRLSSPPCGDDERARDHVVERLFLFSEAGHHVPDRADQSRKDLPEKPHRGPYEADPLAVHVGHPKPQHALPKSRLTRRALLKSIIQP
jgi:hypothetical protein